MGFRDENEALRARIRSLESETETLRRENSRLEDALAAGSTTPTLIPVTEEAPLPETASLRDRVLDRVSKREAAERSAEHKDALAAAAKRSDALRRVQRRRKRVRIAVDSSHSAIHIDPHVLGDQLRRQAPWGFGFALLNPGIFVVIGLAFLFVPLFELEFPWALIVPLLVWVCALSLINLAYAKWKSPPYRFVLTGEHFAFYKRGKDPVLFGRVRELEVNAPEPDEAELHQVRVSDGRESETMEFLCADDVIAITSAIRSARRSGKGKK